MDNSLEIQRLLARNVRELREDRSWSQNKLAEEGGLSLSAVQRIEAAERWPEIETIRGLSRAFKLPEVALFARTNVVLKDPVLTSLRLEVIRAAIDADQVELESMLAVVDVEDRDSRTQVRRRAQGKKSGRQAG
jgi:transcriptional regulator with XRE-family HTH domain